MSLPTLILAELWPARMDIALACPVTVMMSAMEATSSRLDRKAPSGLDRKAIVSWCLYDFANSSYSAVIAAVVFPVYFGQVIVGNEHGLGDLWWGRAVSLSMLLVAFTSPFLGGVADSFGLRRTLLRGYTLVSVLAVAGMATLGPGMVIPGFILAVVANAGMEGALVFYNAYLPDLVPASHYGRVSAWGFALGYAGSALSLLMALPLVRAGRFGAVWFTVAGFFLLFSLPLLLRRHHGGLDTADPVADRARRGARETVSSLREIVRNRSARRFLMAYLFYEDGVNTVIVFSSLFAATTLGFRPEELVFLYLGVQLTALLGSAVMASPMDRWGAVQVVRLSLVLWIAVAVMGYLVRTKTGFWALATMAGLGLGTIQAASRALYASYIPRGSEARYFGVYALTGKTSAILGPLVFGEVSALAGSQRPAILSVGLFFVTGFVLLIGLRKGESGGLGVPSGRDGGASSSQGRVS